MATKPKNKKMAAEISTAPTLYPKRQSKKQNPSTAPIEAVTIKPSAWEKQKAAAAANNGPCASKNCDKPAMAKGYCWGHYQRLRRGENPDKPLRVKGATPIQMTGVNVSVELDSFLKWYAASSGLTLYELVRQILDTWYQQHRPAASAQPPPLPAQVSATPAHTGDGA